VTIQPACDNRLWLTYCSKIIVMCFAFAAMQVFKHLLAKTAPENVSVTPAARIRILCFICPFLDMTDSFIQLHERKGGECESAVTLFASKLFLAN
jgi:hypothetical protein